MNTTQTQAKYGDILYLPHHISKKHTQMPVLDRAAQFAPFAALTGHDAAIKETARLTDRKIELDDEQKQQISETLTELSRQLTHSPTITITYFTADKRKEGGFYTEYTGIPKKIDLYQRILKLDKNIQIKIDDILYLSIQKQ